MAWCIYFQNSLEIERRKFLPEIEAILDSRIQNFLVFVANDFS